MIVDAQTILVFSGFLFVIGLCGLAFNPPNIIKTIISIEMMFCAGIVNFCYESSAVKGVTMGSIFSIVAIVVSSIACSIIVAVYFYTSSSNDFFDGNNG